MLSVSIWSAEQDIQVENAWIRAAPPTVRTYAAYLTIKNNKTENMQLVKITSEYFEQIEMHHSSMENGIAKMEEFETIEINFSPGDYHLMLINNKKPIEQGDQIPLTLIFSDGSHFSTIAEIKRNNEPEHHHYH